MYFPGNSQPNITFAGIQRTFYPKYVNYYGNGSGRDSAIICNNGGLTSQIKNGLRNAGFHFERYNSYVKRNSKSPLKESTTFQYQSDGSGRDSYVVQDNGGMRPEYNKYNKSPQRLFQDSLRSGKPSPVRYFKDSINDKSDITLYSNWKSSQAKKINIKHALIQKDLIARLSTIKPLSKRQKQSTTGNNQKEQYFQSQILNQNMKNKLNASTRNITPLQSHFTILKDTKTDRNNIQNQKSRSRTLFVNLSSGDQNHFKTEPSQIDFIDKNVNLLDYNNKMNSLKISRCISQEEIEENKNKAQSQSVANIHEQKSKTTIQLPIFQNISEQMLTGSDDLFSIQNQIIPKKKTLLNNRRNVSGLKIHQQEKQNGNNFQMNSQKQQITSQLPSIDKSQQDRHTNIFHQKKNRNMLLAKQKLSSSHNLMIKQ